MKIGELQEFQAKTAVIYLRVSTREQAQRGGQAEGFSIPAQRTALYRKAESLSATVVAEFVDAGESAKSTDRPELQRMLAYLAEHPPDYVLVHKVDRLARNRVDDVEITMAIKKSGATLVSASENIDETPSGMLLHGIMSSIAEFYSRNLAAEVHKGMSQKAQTGGTPGRAPLGYRNVGRVTSEGREERTVAVDPVRAGLITWAFKAFATGDWTLVSLVEELELRGLTTRQTPKQPARPVRPNVLHSILTNPYYKGEVVYRGVAHRGSHEPLTDAVTWQRVQDVLAAHAVGEKRRDHPHYLKSTVYCGDCESRLVVANAKNRHGVVYPYFVCLGRQEKRTSCKRKAMLIATVEGLVETYWTRVRLDPVSRVDLEEHLKAVFKSQAAEVATEQKQLQTAKNALLAKRGKLVEAIYSGALPTDLIASEQKQLATQLALVEERLKAMASGLDRVEFNLTRVLDMAESGYADYLGASPLLRRMLNQACFERLYVDDWGVRPAFAAPFDVLLGPGAIALAPTEPDTRAGDGSLGMSVLARQFWSTPYETGSSARGATGASFIATKLSAFGREGSKADGLVPLRNSLLNPSPPLARTLELLEQQHRTKKRQDKYDHTKQIIAQSGASHPSAVRLHIKENHKLKPAEVRRLVQAHQAGATQVSLAKRFNIHEQTVRRHLRRHRQSAKLACTALTHHSIGAANKNAHTKPLDEKGDLAA